MTVSTSQTGYFALLYKVEIATGTFLIYIDFTSFVESDGASITSAEFKMTLTSSKHSGMPLTSTIYEDFKKSFKELFE